MEAAVRKSSFLRPGICSVLDAYRWLGFSWSKNCVCKMVLHSFQDMMTVDLPSFYSEDSRSAWKQKKAQRTDFQVFPV